jgi:hypothetical protein
MRGRLVTLVEELAGIEVRAFMSTSHIDPDLAAELYVLDRALARRAAASTERARE